MLSLVRPIRSFLTRLASPFLRERQGGIALIFGLVVVPLIVVVGFGVDYLRTMNARDRMQRSLDEAILVAAKDMASKTDDELTADIKVWISKTFASGSSYKIGTVSLKRTDQLVTVDAEVDVPTAFSGLIGLSTMKAKLSGTATGSNEVFMNVYLMLDNSASMGLAATSAAQSTMQSKVGCVFACHESEGATYKIGKKKYTTTYDAARALGVSLRTDVMNTAALKVIDMIDDADPKHERIKVGVYYFNTDLVTAHDLTYSTSAAKAALSGTESQKGVDGTFYDVSLTSMAAKIGTPGDGSSESKPVKLVLLVTDGVYSQRTLVLTSSTTQKKVGPFNPTQCKKVTDKGATLGVLYTEYLSIAGDWGYDATVGNTMGTSSWGGTIASGYNGSTKRRDYLPQALTDCATKGYFISANSTTEIETGLGNLFSSWLSKIRISK